jgi:hypothetical protein
MPKLLINSNMFSLDAWHTRSQPETDLIGDPPPIRFATSACVQLRPDRQARMPTA